MFDLKFMEVLFPNVNKHRVPILSSLVSEHAERDFASDEGK